MRVLPVLNGDAASSIARRKVEEDDLYVQGEVEHRYRAWLSDMYERYGEEVKMKREPSQNLTLGYVTRDVGGLSKYFIFYY